MKKLFVCNVLITVTFLLFLSCGADKESSDTPSTKGETQSTSTTTTATKSTAKLSGELVIYNTPSDFMQETGENLPNYKESPNLATLVSSGDLEPVEDRVGLDPMVVQPTDAIGLYGGILKGAATTPTSEGWDVSTIREQKLFSYMPDLSTVYPNIAKSAEFTNENKTMIVHLREGMKWSDGVPFTADDFVFWYEDIFLNEELTETLQQSFWTIGGEPVKITKIDTYTVQFDFVIPSPTITAKIATSFGFVDPFAPAHYLKQFHIDYNSTANDLAKKEGLRDWEELFMEHYVRGEGGQKQIHIGTPVLNPWVWESVDTAGNRFFMRNPYYWKVDIDGNQLPYIDEMHRLIVQNTDAKKLGTLNGNYSLSVKDMSLTDYPMIKENEAKGNYRAFLGEGVKGSFLVFGINLTWEGDPKLTELMSDVRFRQAMSLAINRDELNEVVFLGQGLPRQLSPIPQTSYAEPWMEEYFADYDIAKANALLDEMGLVWDSKKEYRLRPDGSTLTVPHEYWRWADNVAKAVELTTEYWKAIGLKMEVKELEPSLYFERRAGNDLAMVTWGGDYQTEMALYVNSEWSQPPWQALIMNPWFLWKTSKGEDGVEPPEQIKELFEWNEQRTQEIIGSDVYMELSKKIATRNLENLYQIGTVGLVPNVVVFQNNLKNTPTQGVFTSDSNFFQTYVGETFYFNN